MLQERAAELLGLEAALFVPSGTMGNQIAVKVHTRPGDEVILEADCHIFNYELGMMAAFSGVLPRPDPDRSRGPAPEGRGGGDQAPDLLPLADGADLDREHP
jgi:threonine aldolase